MTKNITTLKKYAVAVYVIDNRGINGAEVVICHAYDPDEACKMANHIYEDAAADDLHDLTWRVDQIVEIH